MNRYKDHENTDIDGDKYVKPCEKSAEGKYVLYVDHQKEIARLEEEILNLKNEARKVMILIENKKHYAEAFRKLTGAKQ